MKNMYRYKLKRFEQVVIWKRKRNEIYCMDDEGAGAYGIHIYFFLFHSNMTRVSADDWILGPEE